MDDPWRISTSKIVPWPTDYTEINLKDELAILFYGGDEWSAKAHPIIYRRFDRTQQCSCVEDGRARTDCPICDGDGFMYTEQIYMTRKRTIYGSGDVTAEMAIVNVREILYYFEAHVLPKHGDVIFEIDAPDNRIPRPPHTRLRRYNIESAEDFRDINAERTFWTCWCEEQIIGQAP